MPRIPNMNDVELREWFFNNKTIIDNGCWEWNGVITLKMDMEFSV